MIMPTLKKIHFVGIGGSGMSGLAHILLTLGYHVSGSDAQRTPVTEKLTRAGATVFYQHAARNLSEVDLLVLSSAIPKTNPEFVEARRRHIPVMARAALLAELMDLKFGIAISGTHGKTTTTTLVGAVLQEGGLDPTLIVGGRVKHLKANARWGKGSYLVAEADESDGTFLKLNPKMAVVTNIDREHMNFYKTIAAVKKGYRDFCRRVPPDGKIILGIDNALVRSLAKNSGRPVVTYGLCAEATIRATHLKFKGFQTEALITQRIGHRLHKLGTLRLNLAGEHNVVNALAAIAVGLELKIPFSKIVRGLRRVKGIARRMELVKTSRAISIFDDYGHHPSEIKATLQALKNGWKQPITLVFQPHRYTRTQDLFKEFLGAFDGVKNLIVTDIYAASEKKIHGVSAQKLAAAIRHPRVDFEPDFDKIVKKLRQTMGTANGHRQTPQILLTMGAGDVWKVGQAFSKELK